MSLARLQSRLTNIRQRLDVKREEDDAEPTIFILRHNNRGPEPDLNRWVFDRSCNMWCLVYDDNGKHLLPPNTLPLQHQT